MTQHFILSQKQWRLILVGFFILLYGLFFDSAFANSRLPKRFIGLPSSSLSTIEILPEWFSLEAGEVFDIQLPAGPIRWVVDETRMTPSGRKVLVIHPEGQDALRYQSLIVSDLESGSANTFGRLLLPGHRYQIDSLPGETWLVDANLARMADADGCGNTMLEPFSESESISEATQARTQGAAGGAGSETSIIDVMFVLPEGVRAVYSQSTLQTRLDYLVEVTNQALLNSNIDMRYRIVHLEPTTYSESHLLSEAIVDLREGINGFEPIAERRAKYGADFVSVYGFFVPDAAGYGGVDGFATAIIADSGDYVFAHESAHNMGSGHDYTEGLKGYNYGYHNDLEGWYTIMGDNESDTYERLPIYSAPLLECPGDACGIAAGTRDPAADHVLAFTENKAGKAALYPSEKTVVMMPEAVSVSIETSQLFTVRDVSGALSAVDFKLTTSACGVLERAPNGAIGTILFKASDTPQSCELVAFKEGLEVARSSVSVVPVSLYTIDPPMAKIDLSKTQQTTFQVLSDGVPVREAIFWTVKDGDPGSIDTRGTYTAEPMREGTFHIEATVGRTRVEAVVAISYALNIGPDTDGVPVRHVETFFVEGIESDELIWSASQGTIDENGRYLAPDLEGTALIRAQHRNDPNIKGEKIIQILPATLGVTLSPPSATVMSGQYVPFTFSLTDPSEVAVSFKFDLVNPDGCGTINVGGLYQAPLKSPNQDRWCEVMVTVTAASGNVGVARAPVFLPSLLYVEPAKVDILEGGQQDFDVYTNAPTPLAVDWESDCGPISSDGLLQVPEGVRGACTVTARVKGQGSLYATSAVERLQEVYPQLAGSQSALIALRNDGRVWGWGNLSTGVMGETLASQGTRLTPVKLEGLPQIETIAGFSSSILALDLDHNLWAWGSNVTGIIQVPSGGIADPVILSDSGDWVDVMSSGTAALALRRDGTVWAWGKNMYGQFGTCSVSESTIVPFSNRVQVLPVSVHIQSIGMSLFNAWALDDKGRLWVWGENAEAQLGTGHTEPVCEPVEVTAISEPVREVASGSDYVMALTESDQVFAWGNVSKGRTGGSFGNSIVNVVVPQIMSTPEPVQGVYALPARTTSFLHLAKGGFLAAGSNTDGVTATGSSDKTIYTWTPVLLNEVAYFTMSMGNNGAAIDKDHLLYLWGSNTSGQLMEDPAALSMSAEPLEMPWSIYVDE